MAVEKTIPTANQCQDALSPGKKPIQKIVGSEQQSKKLYNLYPVTFFF